MLLQGIQSAIALKTQASAKKADGIAITIETTENVVKKNFGKLWFEIPLDVKFLKHPIYPYGLKENLTARL